MPDVKITVEAATAQAKENLDRLTKSVEGVGLASTPAATKISGLVGGVALGTIAADFARKALDFFKDGIVDCMNAGLEGLEAQAAMESAIKSTGKEAYLSADGFSAYADELMGVTTQDDEAIKKAQMLLINLTTLDQQGINTATKGALGLARVMGSDLQSAAGLVAKAMEGNYLALQRFLPALKQTSDEGKKHEIVMRFMADAYKQEQDAANTTVGRLEQLKNIFGEVKESIGATILKSDAFTKALDSVKRAMQAFNESGAAQKGISIVLESLTRRFTQGLNILAMEWELAAAKQKYYTNVGAGTVEVFKLMGQHLGPLGPGLQELGKKFEWVGGILNLFKKNTLDVIPPTKDLTDAQKKAAEEARKLAAVITGELMKATKGEYEFSVYAARAA